MLLNSDASSYPKSGPHRDLCPPSVAARARGPSGYRLSSSTIIVPNRAATSNAPPLQCHDRIELRRYHAQLGVAPLVDVWPRHALAARSLTGK